jgi:hypothetical protein
MLIVPPEVVTGLLVNAVSATGRILAGSASGHTSRRTAADLDIARWLDTGKITENLPDLPDMSDEEGEELTQILRGDNAQAVLQALLAARLTDAPESDVGRIRAPWDVLFAAERGLPVGVAETLFDFYDTQIGALVARLEGTDAKLLPQIRNDAFATRVINILGAIQQQTAALSRAPGHRTEADFLTRYRRHVLEEHGKLQPPDLERRRKVPIADIYVDASIVPDFPPGEVSDQDALNFPGFRVRELAGIIDRSVLLGDPGGGKTTAANVLICQFADDPEGEIPFLVTLRKYAAEDPPEHSVAEYIEDTLGRFYQCPPPPGLVDLLLLTGRALVVFDGLDELLDTSRRADVSARVERFCSEYPLVPVLVTSRVLGYDQARLDDSQFRCYRLVGFANEQVREYAHKWFALEPGAESNEAEAFLAESANVPDLRSNPLMLSLMCILYRGQGSLPQDRTGVYEQCANLLFRRWDEHRHIHRELRAGRLVEPALRYLAWWLFTRNDPQTAVTEAQIVTETAEFLHTRGFESKEDAKDAAAEFVRFCRERMWVLSVAGTTARGEPLYAFTHRTFLEYFAAARLASTCDTPEDLARTLAPRLAGAEWTIVAELAIQLKDRSTDLGADRIYRELLTAAQDLQASRILSAPVSVCVTRSYVLTFLGYDLQSVSISPSTMRNLTRAVLDHALDHDPHERHESAAMEYLLANCTGYQELVTEELTARVIAMTGSSDPIIRRRGLRFVFNLGTRLMGQSLRALAVMDDEAAEYWGQWSTAQAHAHDANIVTEAASDGWLRTAALTYGLITTDQALAMPGGLDVLIRDHPEGIYGLGSFGYLVQMAIMIFEAFEPGAMPYGPLEASELEPFAAVGRYLLHRPQLPWTTGQRATNQPIYLWQLSPGHKAFRPDDITYLGIAAVVLTSVEMGRFDLSSGRGPTDVGPMGLLVRYLHHRQTIDNAELPDLPVPENFRLLFRRWADRKVHLTKRTPKVMHGQ